VVLASVADVKLAEIDRPDRARIDRQFANDGGKKELVTGESAKEPVKTIAWGMPDVSGASAVNTGVHT
jgi:hypothetical protein